MMIHTPAGSVCFLCSSWTFLVLLKTEEILTGLGVRRAHLGTYQVIICGPQELNFKSPWQNAVSTELGMQHSHRYLSGKLAYRLTLFSRT